MNTKHFCRVFVKILKGDQLSQHNSKYSIIQNVGYPKFDYLETCGKRQSYTYDDMKEFKSL